MVRRPDAWRCQGGNTRPLGGIGDGRDRTFGDGAIEPDRSPGIGHDVPVTTDLVTPRPTGPESDRSMRSVCNPGSRSPLNLDRILLSAWDRDIRIPAVRNKPKNGGRILSHTTRDPSPTLFTRRQIEIVTLVLLQPLALPPSAKGLQCSGFGLGQVW